MENSTTSAEQQHSYLLSSIPSSSPWAVTQAPSATSTATTTNPAPTNTSANSNRTATTAPISASLPSANWVSSNATQQFPQFVDGSLDPAAPVDFQSHFDLLPWWLPHQSNVYQARLDQYNRLISPSRGGGLQAQPLPPVVSSSNAQAGPRSRSSSKVSLKDHNAGKGSAVGGHGSRAHHSSDKNRSGITHKEAVPAKMPPKQATSQPGDSSKKHPSRSTPPNSTHNLSQGPSHSSSVPSTPHQRARQFSFESRDQSPSAANNNPSPRSAYSETNSTLPSLRPLPPPRHAGCKYETSQVNSRRRIPYSIGNEPLEKLPLDKIKGKLTPEEEKQVATDMREVYNRLLPSDKVEERRKKLVHKLETIFNEEWPGRDIRAHLFGSSGNLLCSDDSDVDVCITTPWHELEGVCIIADLLARRGMEKVVCISAAKVPIVKIWDPELSLACDMNVNNTLALENTRMIRVYVETDPRVRQLAMIIKYWTRRRIVNDAAFGGTLSSYTWICMIIAFLQLRTPSILPTLHQLPYKIHRPDSKPGEFADNLKRLRGYGKENKSSEADLLFQFFRFYAHEFDYDKYVLSIRTGKLLTKADKKWHYAINNQLCVEEPFNITRNLGNTADEYSFRGLHEELRRAFKLISEAKFTEACEQYEFPKEEERARPRPREQPRPALLRSSSQSQTNNSRGGRGGRGRHSNNYRGGGPNRRASSSIPSFDPNVYAPAVNVPQDMSWFPSAQVPFPYANEIMSQMAYQENIRLYAQPSTVYNQSQPLTPHMIPSNSTSGPASSSDRARTESIDSAPLSAPLRPEHYTVYNMTLWQPFFNQIGGYGTYPSATPVSNNHTESFRRPLQRSTVTRDKGAPASSSSLRSQSQPAARSQSVSHSAVNGQAQLAASHSSTNIPGLAPKNPNGVPIPSFISDDAEFDDETPKARSSSPKSEAFPGYFVAESPSSQKARQQPSQGLANGIAFGDLSSQSSTSSPGRRRLSTDQLPQTILDRRMRRHSRSPSPAGDVKTLSAAQAASQHSSTPVIPNPIPRDPSRPLVVNGSGLKASMTTESLHTPFGNESSTQGLQPTQHGLAPAKQRSPVIEQSAQKRAPVVVNGSHAPSQQLAAAPSFAPLSEESSFRDRINMMNTHYLPLQHIPQTLDLGITGQPPLTPSQMLAARHAQEGDAATIAPLDLAIHNGAEAPVLSPVYEASVPSPLSAQKPDSKAEKAGGSPSEGRKQTWANISQQAVKKAESQSTGQELSTQLNPPKKTVPAQNLNSSRENGHVRGARSESDSGWQKAGKGKKKVASNARQANPEPLPQYNSERKGG